MSAERTVEIDGRGVTVSSRLHGVIVSSGWDVTVDGRTFHVLAGWVERAEEIAIERYRQAVGKGEA